MQYTQDAGVIRLLISLPANEFAGIQRVWSHYIFDKVLTYANYDGRDSISCKLRNESLRKLPPIAALSTSEVFYQALSGITTAAHSCFLSSMQWRYLHGLVVVVALPVGVLVER